MNRITLLGIGILIVASIPGCHATTFADDIITFTETPSVVEIEPGSEASFDVTLMNVGSQYADVDINNRSIPDGISIVDNGGTKLVDMRKSVTYRITIHANNDIAPGTYRFEIADRSDIDRNTWETINVRVGGERAVAEPTGVPEGRGRESTKKNSPGLGAIAAVSVLLLAYRLGSGRS
ncbi:MAG: hypothetical protein C4B59_10900 [Candidatus Methanogaster sp.]|uniref:Uncharacterized protein n=1 Tax=Candidatus Methanogaster sp. TaxID=3386292 RepID=A0AC61L1K4_9EURY|nr:MAG: hypothetical protein C4B59_10900 [ANME-2 cluster archaeon]